MNRRKAIYGFLGLGAIAITGTTWNKLFKIYGRPDLYYLDLNKELIAEIADTIIPATTTPGAKDLKIEDQILLFIKGCADTRTQNNVLNGLKELTDFTLSKYNKAFVQCTKEERISTLTYFEEKEAMSSLMAKIMSKVAGDQFIAAFKKYTAISYCTSERGAKQGLAYLYVPGEYNGCMQLREGQKAWATK